MEERQKFKTEGEKGQIYTFKKFITSKGVIKSLEQKTFEINRKTVEGFELLIETKKGTDLIYFPKVFSQTEKNALLNRKVGYVAKYNEFSDSPMCNPSQTWKYYLVILEGPYKGQKFDNTF